MTFSVVSKSIFHVEDSKAARILEQERPGGKLCVQ